MSGQRIRQLGLQETAAHLRRYVAMFCCFLRFGTLLCVGLMAVGWAPAHADPMKLQELREPLAITVQRNTQPTIRPLYESLLETPYDEQHWRNRRAIGSGEAQQIPTGFVASLGRLGLAIDSSDGRPKIKGLAWSLNRSTSLVAGGNLGGGGIGASLSVRVNF